MPPCLSMRVHIDAERFGLMEHTAPRYRLSAWRACRQASRSKFRRDVAPGVGILTPRRPDDEYASGNV